MKLERILVGQINLHSGVVDITDPCYNKDVWCRMQTEVKPGTYNCYSYVGEDADWGKRVWLNQIVIADDADSVATEEKVSKNRSWRNIGKIGVDAGLAGFFDEKPDFGDEEWDSLCDWMLDDEKNSACSSYIKDFNGKDGFWTTSGIGDGGYDVFAIRNTKGQIVALEIRF